MAVDGENSETLFVRDLMTSEPIVITPDVSVRRVRALMQQAAIRHLPVVDEDGIVGIVSERDLQFMHGVPGVFEKVNMEDVEAALDAPVGVVMKSRFLVERDVLCVQHDDELITAVTMLLGSGMGALPVLDEDEDVVGIISTVDLLRWMADEMSGRA